MVDDVVEPPDPPGLSSVDRDDVVVAVDGVVIVVSCDVLNSDSKSLETFFFTCVCRRGMFGLAFLITLLVSNKVFGSTPRNSSSFNSSIPL